MWLFEGKEVIELPENCIGFVYLIENNLNGCKYIGKKLAKFSRTSYKVVKLKNGKKKRKKVKKQIDSDWLTYFGSNDKLNQDVLNLGSENFTRTILYFCYSKAECSYLEAKEQFARKVLESDDYYNNYIQVRVHGSLIKDKILKNNTQ